MNIKKMFTALSAMVVAVTMTLPSASVFGAEYSQELQDAYNWAYSKGVTTMSTIDNANMYGAITRAEMAKMLSVYSTEVLGNTPDTSKACTFTDIDSVKGDLHDFIIESCQLGIMGQGITAFRPYDTISRAEFGTALSRVLWGDKYEGGTPYYANHLNALKSAAIMNQIANAESTKEIRGYVMLMLMRSEGGSNVDCEDPAIALACLDPELDVYKDCPAACREDNNADEDGVVKSGSLAVSSEAADDRSVVVAKNASAISDLDTLTFKTSEEVTINKVVLEKYGFSNAEGLVKNIWLEDEDGNKITTENTPNSKGLVNLTVKKDYKVVDGILNATIVVETNSENDGAKAGGTIGFKVKDVDSTAKDVDLGNYKAYRYDVVAYDGAVAKVSARGGSKEYNYEAGESYEISKFKVKAPDDSAILVKGFTLKNTADKIMYDYLDVDEVEVTVAGKTVKATVSINKDEELTVSFKEDVEIAAKENVEFIINAKLNSDFDEYGKAVQFGMTSITATDKNNARINIDTTGVTFVTYKFLGGKVKFTNNKLGNVEAALNSSNVLIADGTVTVSEAIEGTGVITITQASFTDDDSNILWPAEAIEEIRLEVAGDEIVGTFDPANRKATSVKVNFKNLDISESGKVKVYVDLKEDARYEGKSMTFSSINWELEYADGDTPSDGVDTAGSVSVSKLTFQKSEGSLTNTISSDEVEFTKGSSETHEIFKGKYTAKKSAINLNKFTLTGNWTSAKGKVHVYLDLNGDEVADAKLDCTATPCKATDTFSDVLVKADSSIDVVVRAEIDAVDTTSTPVKFTLTLEGEDENDNPGGVASKQSAKVSIVGKGTPEIEKGAAKSTVLLRGSEATIAEMNVKPSGASDSIDLESVRFAEGSNDCDNIKLVLGSFEKSFASVGGECVADGFAEEIAKEGKTLKIVLDEEPSEEEAALGLIKVSIEDLYLNDTRVSGKFTKGYADAVLTFEQKNKGSMTQYTIKNIEKYNSTTEVSNLEFYADEAMTKKLVINGLPTEALEKDDTFTIRNTYDPVYVKAVKYTVKRGSSFTQNVVVKYSDYQDFFKTNDDDLRVYDNTDGPLTGNIVE